MKDTVTFDDVLIVPKFSDIVTRKEVDISVNAHGFPYMGLPVISANMDTITTEEMARAMSVCGGQAVLHRFCSIEDNVKMLINSRTGGTGGYDLPFVSIGLGKGELDRAVALKSAGAYMFFVDVAHGAQTRVAKQVKALRDAMGDDFSIVVGNFATGDSVVHFLQDVGQLIEGIKVGIGPGSACTTRIKTGVGYPQLSAVMDIANSIKETGITIIADGGMKTSGDISKALGAGAHMVMLGGMLAGTDETPGELYYENGGIFTERTEGNSNLDDPKLWYKGYVNKVKKYRGSASKESYEVQGKDANWRTAEGESFYVPHKGPVKDVLQDIEGGLRSAMSYVGARNIKEFHAKCEFVKVSPSTVVENGSHGKNDNGNRHR